MLTRSQKKKRDLTLKVIAAFLGRKDFSTLLRRKREILDSKGGSTQISVAEKGMLVFTSEDDAGDFCSGGIRAS